MFLIYSLQTFGALKYLSDGIMTKAYLGICHGGVFLTNSGGLGRVGIATYIKNTIIRNNLVS